MATDFLKDIASEIRGNNLNIPDSDIKAYPVDDEPTKGVFLTPTGGPSEPSGFASTDEWKYPLIQVRVRVPEKDYDEGYQDARDIYDLLQFANVSGYIKWDIREGQPMYMGKDDDGNHNWAMNIETQIIE